MKPLNQLISFLLFLLAASAYADEPDLNYESELHGIFLNFHNQPTPSDQWAAVVGNRQTESFAIRDGDTLWDISRALFADGNFWPKIWSYNQFITNPHLISPGMTIQFALGDESNPPAFTITRDSIEPVQAEDSSAGSTGGDVGYSKVVKPDGSVEEIEIPKPSRSFEPVLQTLPSSLPAWQSADRGRYDSAGIEFVRRPITFLKDRRTLSTYVTEAPPSSLGKIMETETGSRVAGQLQYVYTAFPPGTAKKGDVYLAILYRGPLKKISSQINTKGGSLIEVQGELELVDQVRGKDDDFDWYRALITRSVSPIETDATLVRGKVTDVEINESGPRSQVVSQIIGGNEDSKGFLFGAGSIVFLNRGSEDGLRIGQVLPIRKNQLSRFAESFLRQVSQPIGTLQIAYVEPEFSTALVIRSWEDIRPGDMTGEGEIFSDDLNLDEDALSGKKVRGGNKEIIDFEEAKQKELSEELDETSSEDLQESINWEEPEKSENPNSGDDLLDESDEM